jgi:hypothetical protein
MRTDSVEGVKRSVDVEEGDDAIAGDIFAALASC